MTALPSACVIGAGSSGIAALKALAERGIPVECFEKSDRVGGNWVFAFWLRREMRAGARRARGAGFRPPVPARASLAAGALGTGSTAA